jgi:hypothetical protein
VRIEWIRIGKKIRVVFVGFISNEKSLLKKLPDSFQMEIFGGSPIRFSTLKV